MVMIRDFLDGERRALELRMGGGVERNYPGTVFELECCKPRLALFCQTGMPIQRHSKRLHALSFRAKRATQTAKENNKGKQFPPSLEHR